MHRAFQLNNARTKDNSSNNATLSSLLNGVSLHNTEVRLPCKGVKKVKYDSSNKLPVWVSNNLKNDSTASKHYSTSSFVNSGRRISVQANLRAIRGWYGRPVKRIPRHEVIALSQYMSIIRFL